MTQKDEADPVVLWAFVKASDLRKDCLVHGDKKYQLCEPLEAWRPLKEGASLARLKSAIAGSQTETAQFMAFLGHLARQGVVEEVLTVKKKKLAARQSSLGFVKRNYSPGSLAVLSKYASIRLEDGAATMESPLTRCRVKILDSDKLGEIFGEPKACESSLRRFLFESGFLILAGVPEQAERLHWEFHDLHFHWRSRPGGHHYACGGLGREVPPAELREPITGDFLTLPAVDLQHIQENDITLTAALESRRSRRTGGERVVGLRELSELLFRTLRRTKRGRLYPSGGGRYELEVYLNLRDCQDIADGFYRYDPFGHRLERLEVPNSMRRRHLRAAQTACAAHSQPRVFIVLAARFQRLSSRYKSICYALILKHVGIVLQTLSLVCEALDLPACAVGTGDSDDFSALIGLDPLEEDAVGEFVLW